LPRSSGNLILSNIVNDYSINYEIVHDNEHLTTLLQAQVLHGLEHPSHNLPE